MYDTKEKGLKVCVALSTDSNYFAPTIIVLKSIALHVSRFHSYCIYILSDGTIDTFSRKMFFSAVKDKNNIRLVFINTANMLGNVKISENSPVKGVTTATYLRFLLPELLKNTDKVLYMDTDTLVLDDIAKIFSCNIDGYYVAGVRDIAGFEDKEKRCNELGTDNLEEYINAGVLLMNLKQFREDMLAPRLIKAATEKSYTYNDQDIINAFCFGKISFLPPKCNAILQYLNNPDIISKELEIDYRELTEHPIILHYAGRFKPWYYPEDKYSKLWWAISGTLPAAAKVFFRLNLSNLLKSKRSKKR